MKITDKNFNEEILCSKIPVFLELWASWCPPCKMMSPIMDAIEKSYQGKVKVCKLNIDIYKNIASKFDVKGVPTFLFIKNGKVVRKEVAAKSEEGLKKIINKTLI